MTQWVRPSYLNDSPLQYKRWQSRPPLKSSGAICRTGEMLSIIIITIAWSRLAMNGSHDYVILMLMKIMMMIRRSTWSRLAMNGGHVHEPKFSTRGRPALQHCHQNDSNHDIHYDLDGQDELICDHGHDHNKRKKFDECDVCNAHLAKEMRGSFALVSKSINSGFGANWPTWSPLSSSPSPPA